MVYNQIWTRLCSKALAFFADAGAQLLFARGLSEIRRRSSHIVNVSLKIRAFGKHFCLAHKRFVASRLYRPSLMKRNCAERTRTKTAAHARKRKKHFL